MDICIEVEKTDYNMLLSKEYAESSKAVRERVEKAQNLQKNRFINDGILFNSQMNSEEIEKYCSLSDDINEWFMKALVKLDVSARSYHKILRVARTIADLDYSANIEIKHLGEAIKLNNSVI